MRTKLFNSIVAGLVGMLVICSLVMLAAVPLLAEVEGNKGISVTSTSATTTFTDRRTSVLLVNDTASANELYARVFRCGETAAAATTSSPIRLEPGESLRLSHNTRSEPGIGYCAVSYVTAAAETATLRLVFK